MKYFCHRHKRHAGKADFAQTCGKPFLLLEDGDSQNMREIPGPLAGIFID